MLEFLRTVAGKARAVFAGRKLDEEFAEELRAHLANLTEENIAKGMTREQAERAARMKLGGFKQLAESHREARGLPKVETVLQDLRYGLRMLRKSPGFTAVAVLTLALGIGANTAIFSLTDQILLRSLPVPHPEELAVLRSPGPHHGHTWSDIDDGAQSFSYPMYKDLRERATVFSGLLACRGVDLNVSWQGATQAVRGALVSGNFFTALEVPPALGRVFTLDDETAPGANTVAVLSYSYWTRQFGADPSILNKPLIVNSVPLTIVGVARQGFQGVQIGETPDVFVPVTMKAQMAPNSRQTLEDRNDHWLPILGRLKPGMTREKAQASLQPIYGPILESDAKLLKLSGRDLKRFVEKPLLLASGSQGRAVLQADAKAPLLVLMGMVGLVLLITCANLAGLLLARGEARQREIALRMAMGSSRRRLVRQLLTETFLIGIAGGAGGVLLASWCLHAMVAAIHEGVGVLGMESGIDPRVLGFALAVTLVTSVLFGAAPALRGTRVDLQATLKGQSSGASQGRSNVRLRQVLIAAQVALTAVLLASAGLFARTLNNLEHADLGVNTSRVLQLSVAPGLNGASTAQTRDFVDRALKEFARVPGVQSVTVSNIPIFADADRGFNITAEGYTARPGDDMDVLADNIGPGYFSTLGTPLIAGREFTEADTASSPKTVIINQKLAQRFFAKRNPIGMHIVRGNGVPNWEIVGVVADSKWDGPRSDIVPFVYMPYSQTDELSTLTFYVRTERDPAAMAGTLRSVMNGLDANLPVNDLRTLDEQVNHSMNAARIVAALSAAMALLAALLAALGLYGVLAYVVAQRTREIGTRMALGAQAGDVLRMVMKQGLLLALGGGAAGIAIALGVMRYLKSLLYGVEANDPVTIAGVAGLLLFVGLAACWIPARRAMRVDPMVALRYE